MNNTTRFSPTGKFAVRALLGGVVGYLGASAVFGSGLILPGPTHAVGAIALVGVGFAYLLMSVIVGLGVVFPAVGAKILNVADRGDLENQRALLGGSTLAMAALGGAMVLLAIGGPGGQVPGALAVSALALALVLMAAITVLQRKHYDELMSQVSLESSGLMLAIAAPVLMVWSALAHTGLATALDPLGVIALLAGAMLLASFVAAGRRGLLTQR